MYKFKFYNADLHIPGDKDLFLLSPVINMGANQSWTVTAKIMDQHPNFLKLKTLKYGLQVYKNDKLIAKCRLMQFKRSFNNTYQIFAEDKLAALNDSECRPYEFAGNPEDLFDWFLENHNSQVGDEQKLLKGNVTVTDPNDYIVRSWEKTTDTWTLIKSRLIDTLGGYLMVRYEEDGDYLDWIKEFTLYSEQSIRFGENLLDLNSVIDATNTYTACIPYGAEIINRTYGEIDPGTDTWQEDTYYTLSGTDYLLIDTEQMFNTYISEGTTVYKVTSEENTGKRLTVESVNDGKDYIINEEMAGEYGIIYAPTDDVTWDDVTRPENLYSKATDWLNNDGVMLLETMELSAVDLATAGIDINSFNMYENVLVETKPHNISTSYLITDMKVAADLSEVLKITIGDTKRTLSAQLAKNKGESSIKTIQGAPGKNGANGKSAYEIWLEAGNTGTEEEYFESLKGEAGTSVKSMTRYYLLQDSSLEAPEKPTEYPPPSIWVTTEPGYDADSDCSLYRVECTLYSDGTWQYTDVSMSSDYESVKSANEKIDGIDAALREEIVEQSSYLLETAEEITMGILAGYTTVSDLETYKKEIENLFSASEEGFSFEFNQLSEKLTNLGNEISNQQQYIRLINGEIHIGDSNSPVTSVYTNDALEFRYNGNMVARFTNEVLEVRNISAENQVAFFDQWAIRKGAYITGKGYNLNDIWIGG